MSAPSKLFLLILVPVFLMGFANGSTAQTAKENFKTVIKHAEEVRDSSFDASIELGLQAVALAEVTDNAEILSTSYKSLAKTYLYKGAFESSLDFYHKAIEQFSILNDSLNIGKITSNIGIIYRRQGKYDKALEQYSKAAKIYDSIDHQEGLAGILLNIGGVYHMMGDLDGALQSYKKAKYYFERTKNTKKLSRVLTNIGVIQYEQKNYKLSLQTQLRALKLNEKEGMIQHKAIILLNIGQSYEALNEFEKALDYYTQCEELRLQLNDLWGLGKIFTFKAVTYDKLEQNKLAETYFKKAEQANKENDLPEDLADTYLFYSKYFERINNPSEALSNFKKYIDLSDSLYATYQRDKVAKLTAQFESEQNAKELQLLQQRTQIQNLELGQKNAWIITLLVVLILLIVGVLVSLRINRLRADHKIMDLRQKVLLTQMNPHFLFNSLTAIQCFILDDKNDDANNYLSRLASLVRSILENSREEFVSLKTELQTLEDYIGMQKLRFDNDISYQFNLDHQISSDLVMIPPMLAQPFVENALIHGQLRSNPEAEIKINISIQGNEDLLQFQIVDNGIGVEEARKQMIKKHHKSLATSIALDRVKIYNFKSSKKMKFEIIDLKHVDPKQHGTQVTYSIPLMMYQN